MINFLLIKLCLKFLIIPSKYSVKKKINKLNEKKKKKKVFTL